jgi:Tfp pilus assembly protein PilO
MNEFSEKFLNTVKQPPVFISAAIVIVVFIAWWFGFWSHESKVISSDNAKHTANLQTINQLNLKLANVEGATQNQPNIVKKLQNFQQAIPAAPDFITLYYEIESIAQSSGVNVTSVSYNPGSSGGSSSANGGLSTITVSINAIGQYSSLTLFEQDLYNYNVFPRLLVINTFTTASATGGAYSLSITATAYYSPQLG